MKALSIILGLLFVLTALSMNASATVTQPVVQGTIYLADGNPAAGATVTVALNGLVFNTTSSDEVGHYYVRIDTEYSLSLALVVNATLGNQTNETHGTLVDGISAYTVNVHMNAPPRYNITILAIDVNTHAAIPAAACFVNEDAYGLNTEVFSGFTDSFGKVNLTLGADGSPYRFTCLKSGTIEFPAGYDAVGIVRTLTQDATFTIALGVVPIPNYNLTITVVNRTSQIALANVGLTIQTSDRSTTIGTATTDQSGQYGTTLPSASYVIIGLLTGYQSNETLVNLNQDRAVLLQLSSVHGSTGKLAPTSILPLMLIVLVIFVTMLVYRRRNASDQ